MKFEEIVYLLRTSEQALIFYTINTENTAEVFLTN